MISLSTLAPNDARLGPFSIARKRLPTGPTEAGWPSTADSRHYPPTCQTNLGAGAERATFDIRLLICRANEHEAVDMAIDTFLVFVGVYANDKDAEADYKLVHDLHVKAGLIDAYDAAVISRRDDGKVKIIKKHETPTAWAVSWAVASGSQPASWSRCSPSPRSAAVSSPERLRAALCWARLPVTPRWV